MKRLINFYDILAEMRHFSWKFAHNSIWVTFFLFNSSWQREKVTVLCSMLCVIWLPSWHSLRYFFLLESPPWRSVSRLTISSPLMTPNLSGFSSVFSFSKRPKIEVSQFAWNLLHFTPGHFFLHRQNHRTFSSNNISCEMVCFFFLTSFFLLYLFFFS